MKTIYLPANTGIERFNPADPYYIAIDGRALESQPTIERAIQARDALAAHEARNNRPAWLVQILDAKKTELVKEPKPRI